MEKPVQGLGILENIEWVDKTEQGEGRDKKRKILSKLSEIGDCRIIFICPLTYFAALVVTVTPPLVTLPGTRL